MPQNNSLNWKNFRFWTKKIQNVQDEKEKTIKMFSDQK